MIARLGRIAASTAVGRGALALGAAAAALVALSPGDLAPVAARAALAAGGIFAAAALVRRRAGDASRLAPLTVVARAPLAQGAGVAVVEADGRRLLVSFGRDGARLLADLERPAARDVGQP